MNHLYVGLCLGLAIASSSNESLANEWPRLVGSNASKCREALQIAKAVFSSNAFYLFAPPEISPELDSVLVLRPQALDISGGDALEANPAVFDKLSVKAEGTPRSAYWQKQPQYGYRLAMLEVPYGWRGDMYSLFAIGEHVQTDEFLAEVRQSGKTIKFAPIVSESWRPPLVFLDKKTGFPWIIEVGQPFQFLADWRIHAAEPQGLNLLCTVQFRAPVKAATSLLPPPVRKLASLLDQTLGRGENEGTLQPTARLRVTVEQTWANIALRPWALGTPYNTRAEVDEGLKSWAQTGVTFRVAYKDIQQHYRLAEQSLAAYYESKFHRSATDAKVLATFALDVALRSHYTFHSTDSQSYLRGENPESNPWHVKMEVQERGARSNPSIEGMPKRLRLSATPHVKR